MINEERGCRDKIKIFDEKIYSQIVGIFQSGVAVGEIKSSNLKGIMNLYAAMIQGILGEVLLYNNHNVDMKDYAEKLGKLIVMESEL